MSKSTIALVVTWVIIGLIGAFSGGYYYAKKSVCKIDDKNVGNTIIDNKASNNALSNPISSTTSDTTSSDNTTNGKTVVQPVEQK